MTPFTLDSLEYKEDIIDFADDPLVLACSAKSLSEKNNDSFYSLDGVPVGQNITQDIRNQAEVIRKHYAQKFFWASLNNQRLSPIRTRIMELLEGRVRSCNENDRGIYYKLPFFYEEDMIYEEFKKNYNTEKPTGHIVGKAIATRLTYLKSSTGIQKRQKIKYFWFTNDTKNLYCIQIELGNNLLGMFEMFLESTPTPVFITYLKEARLDKLHFYKLYSFKNIKEHNA